MTARTNIHIKAIVKPLTGEPKSYTLDELSRLKLLPGSKVTLVDPSTGNTAKGLMLKRKGLDLVIELEGVGEVTQLVDFYSTPDLVFFPNGESPASASSSASAVTADTAVIGQTVAGESIVWKGATFFEGMGGLVVGGLGLGVAVAAASGTGASVAPAPTFSVTVNSEGVVAFEGTATGSITIGLNEVDEVIFSRSGVSAITTVSHISSKILDVPVGAELLINISGSAGADTYTINAPNAATLRFVGNAGAADDVLNIIIQSASANPDLRTLKLDTSGLSGVKKIRFVFPEDEKDVVKITADSNLAGFSEIEVSKGGVDLTLVKIQPGVEFIVNSTLILTLDQFKAMTSLVSITGLGKLTIALTAAEADASLLDLYLQSDEDKPVLIGTTVTVTRDSVPVATPDISQISFEGVPALSAAIADLQSQIDALTADTGADVVQLTGEIKTLGESLADLKASVTALEGVVDGNDAALKASMADLQSALQSADAALKDEIKDLATRLDADIADLQSQIDTLTADAGADVAQLTGEIKTLGESLADLKASVTALEGVVDGNDAALKASMADLQSALQSADAALKDEIKDLATRLDADIADLQSQIDTLTTDAGADVAQLTGEIKTLGESLADLKASVTALEGVVDGNDAALKASMADLQSALESADAALKGEIKALATRLDADIADLQSQITAGDGDIAKLRDDSVGEVDDENYKPASTNSIAGLKSVVEILQSAGLGDPTDPDSAAFQIAALADRIQALEDGLDTTAPAITNIHIHASNPDANGAYGEGDVVTVEVSFGEAVLVNGTPYFELTIGSSTAQASYVSGAGSNKLIFAYTLTAADQDANGIGVPADALKLNAGDSITDAAGNTDVLSSLAVNDANDLVVDNGPLVLKTSGAAIFGSGLTADNVVFGVLIDLNTESQQSVYLSDLDANGSFTVPGSAIYISVEGLASSPPVFTPPGTVITPVLSGFTAFPLQTGFYVIASAESLVVLLKDAWQAPGYASAEAMLAALGVPAAQLTGSGFAELSTEFSQGFLDAVKGRDHAEVNLDIAGHLTVAQAVKLQQAGFDLDNQVDFSLGDHFTTVQAALSNPAQRAALVNALQVVAQGNENPNAMDFTAFDASTNLRIEGGAGNDTINTGRGNDTVVGGLGSDVIRLTTADVSADTIVYETTQDGGGLPVVRLAFSTDTDSTTGDYRAGGQLSVRINGKIVSADVVENDAVASLKALKDAIWQKLGNDGDGLTGPLSAVEVKGDGVLHLVGLTPQTVLHVTPTGDLSARISNPGQLHAETVTFSTADADYTAETYFSGGEKLDRSLRISIQDATATYEIEVAMADTAADSLEALAKAVKDAIAADTTSTGIAKVIRSVAVDTRTGVLTLTAAEVGADSFDVTVAELDVAGKQEQRALAFSTDPADYFAGGKLRFTLDADGDSTTTSDSVLVEADMVAGDPLASMQNLVERINFMRTGGVLPGVPASVSIALWSGASLTDNLLSGTGDNVRVYFDTFSIYQQTIYSFSLNDASADAQTVGDLVDLLNQKSVGYATWSLDTDTQSLKAVPTNPDHVISFNSALIRPAGADPSLFTENTVTFTNSRPEMPVEPDAAVAAALAGAVTPIEKFVAESIQGATTATFALDLAADEPFLVNKLNFGLLTAKKFAAGFDYYATVTFDAKTLPDFPGVTLGYPGDPAETIAAVKVDNIQAFVDGMNQGQALSWFGTISGDPTVLPQSPFVFSYDVSTGLLTVTVSAGWTMDTVRPDWEVARFNLDAGITLIGLDEGSAGFTLSGIELDEFGTQEVETVRFSTDNADYFAGGQVSLTVNGKLYEADMTTRFKNSPAQLLIYTAEKEAMLGTEVVGPVEAEFGLTLVDRLGTLAFTAQLESGETTVNDLLQQINTHFEGRATASLAPDGMGILIASVGEGADVSLSFSQSNMVFIKLVNQTEGVFAFSWEMFALADEGTRFDLGSTAHGGSTALGVTASDSLQSLVDTINADPNRTVNAEQVVLIGSDLAQATRVVNQPGVEFQLLPAIGDGGIVVSKGFFVIIKDSPNLVKYALSSATPTTDTILGDPFVRFDSVDAFLAELLAAPVLVDEYFNSLESYDGPAVMTPSFDAGTGLLRFSANPGFFVEASASPLDYYPVVFEGEIRLTAIEPGANGVEVGAAVLDTAGVKEVESVAFSSVDADYFAGGQLNVTVAGQVINAEMVAGDAQASLNALRVAVEEARGGTFLQPGVGVYSLPVGLVGQPADYELVIDGNTSNLEAAANLIAMLLAFGTEGKAAAGIRTNADGALVFDIYVFEPLDPGTLPVTGIPLVVELLRAGTSDVVGEFTLDFGAIAARDTSVINAAVAAELGSVRMEGSSLVFTAKAAGVDGLSITDAEIEFAGVVQQSTASFSTDDADYVESGAVSVTFVKGATTETVSVDMVAGSASQTLEALRAAVADALTVAEPAVLRLSADKVLAADNIRFLSYAFDFDRDGGVDYSGNVASGNTVAEALATMVNNSGGRLASAVIENGELVITTTATGVNAYIGVVSDDTNIPPKAGFDLPTTQYGVKSLADNASGSGSLGLLDGIAGGVSLSGGTLTFTAADVGADFFSVDQAVATAPAVQQVSELDFSGADESDFRDIVYTDGLGGQVSVSVAGQTVTAAMGEGKAATLVNLQNALVAARDGVYELGSGPAVSASDAGVDARAGANLIPAKGASVTIPLGSGGDGFGSLVIQVKIGYVSNPDLDVPFTIRVDLAPGASSSVYGLVAALEQQESSNNPTGRPFNFQYDPITESLEITTTLTGADTVLKVDSGSVLLSFDSNFVFAPDESLSGYGTNEVPAQQGTLAEAAKTVTVVDVATDDRLAPEAVAIKLIINGKEVPSTFNPAQGDTVQDLLDFISAVHGIAEAKLVNGELIVTTEATGASASLETRFRFSTAAYTTEPVAAVTDALGAVEIVGDKLVLTAKNAGLDALLLSEFAGTQEDAAQSNPHIVDLVFANSTLDNAADGTQLTVTVGGVMVVYTVDKATEGTGDRSTAILQALSTQMLADDAFKEVVASVEKAVDGTSPIPNGLRFTSVLNGPDVLGNAVTITVSITDASGKSLSNLPATFDLVQVGTIVRGTDGALDVLTNDDSGEGGAVDGAVQGPRADDASVTDSLSVTDSTVTGEAADPKVQQGTLVTAGVDTSTAPQGTGALVTAGVAPSTTPQSSLQPTDTTPVDGVDPSTSSQTVAETVNGFDAFNDLAVRTVLNAGGDADTVLGFQLSRDTVVLEGTLASSTRSGEVDKVNGDSSIAALFDLSTDEFGLVSSADSSLDTAGLTSATEVATLLNSLFDFDAVMGGTFDNELINTSVFAVTASDDMTQTAIWAHTQSSSGDNTVTLDELSLLSIVHNTENRFDSGLAFGAINLHLESALVSYE